MSERRFTDEDLTAFIDGEAPTELVAAIAVAMADDTDLRRRIDRLRLLSDALPDAFDGVLQSAPEMPAHLLAPSPMASRWMSRAAVAGALIVGVMIGVFGGPKAQPSGWMDYVAAYQALYVPETLPAARLTGAEDLAALSETLGRSLPEVEIDGLSFRRAQLLGYEGAPLVQMAFVTASGTPVALCIVPLDAEPDRGVETATLEGMAAAHWQSDGYGFLLIGGDDPDLIDTAARDVIAKL